MMTAFSIMLGVLLVSGSDEDAVDRKTAERIAAEADAGMPETKRADEKPTSAQITSVRSDFDRKAGVVMFEDDVCVTYSSDYVMHADRLFAFLSGSNELSRIVALGKVSITNDIRVGRCEMAKFWRKTSEIEMYGDGKGGVASLSDADGNDLRGTRIRFWLDSEQVDVENSQIGVDGKNGGKIL